MAERRLLLNTVGSELTGQRPADDVIGKNEMGADGSKCFSVDEWHFMLSFTDP